MIAFLEGKILKKLPGYAVILTGGVGYEVFIPISTYDSMKKEGDVDCLFIHTIHKEEAFHLYGFKSEDEKALFKILLSASGVGPKLALAILSATGVDRFKTAIIQQDTSALTAISGVGKKRAEKLVFELKEKLTAFYGLSADAGTPVSPMEKDTILALQSLGYDRKDISEAMARVAVDENMDLETLIKKCLQELSRI
ncbi:MAG: Holliday junction branch migration protein RuvA [Spirochaetes bacterium]|nr:Holliday junction branch migration protein RuvA [Spirochaetota bacterium]